MRLDRILPFRETDRGVSLLYSMHHRVMVETTGPHVFVERDGALEPVADRQLEPVPDVAIKNIGAGWR